MRLLLFSDLHLDALFAWMGGSSDARRRRREAQRAVLRRIAELARQRECDALLCAGDLYEQEFITADTSEFLRRTFSELQPIPVYIAPGNHDWYGARSFYARIDWSPNVHIFIGDRLSPVNLGDSITLWGAAHRAPANTDGFLDTFHTQGPGIHLALFHGSERGWFSYQEQGKEPHAAFEEAQIPATGFKHALVGHYHNPKDGEWLTYPGNPEPLAFGESGERGAVILTVDEDGSIAREHVHVASTQVHELTVPVSGCSDRSEVLQRVEQSLAGLTGIARLHVTGDLADSVHLDERDFQDVPTTLDGLKIERSELRVAYDFDRIADEPTVRGEFVRDVVAAPNLSEDDRRRILITGLRALDSREDLEVP